MKNLGKGRWKTIGPSCMLLSILLVMMGRMNEALDYPFSLAVFGLAVFQGAYVFETNKSKS